MTSKILVTLVVLIFGVLPIVQDANATHVFNPDWVPHARLHEVWQLATNAAIGAVCLWLTWARNEVRIPVLLSLCITGGFQFAYLIRGVYGGSMARSDGSEALLMGINLGVIVFGLAVILAVVALALEARPRAPVMVSASRA